MKKQYDHCYIGLMSGTSLDGVDGVLVYLPESPVEEILVLASCYVSFSEDIRSAASDLQQPGNDEIHREAMLANQLAHIYASCVHLLLQDTPEISVRAIGVHGQTIRHRPESGYTRQTNHPALLAELTGIDVIADFRSRDIAAGGQGAPLVPAFHHAVFGSQHETRVVANIGGISNISILANDGSVTGFDTGPGNVLMDYWIHTYLGKKFDENGLWASQGKVIPALLDSLMSEPYLSLPAPKSTGRDLFHADWLQPHLQFCSDALPVDVQATLCAYTATSLAQAILRHATDVTSVYVCGGGAFNPVLMAYLQSVFLQTASSIKVESTTKLGISPERVEALAFAWLAKQFCLRQSGNLPAVTGAKGVRVLGALYPA